MVWAKLDDEILDNEKITRAGVLGFALHVAAITWCCRKLTDGFVPYARVRLLLDLSELDMEYLDATGAPEGLHDTYLDGIHNVGAAQPLRIAERLVSVGLWREDKERGGYWIHDFLEYNPSKEEAEASKAARSTGGKKGAERRWRQTSTMAVAMAPPIGEPMGPPMAIPMAPAWLGDGSGHGSPDGSAMAQRCPDPDPDPNTLSPTREASPVVDDKVRPMVPTLGAVLPDRLRDQAKALAEQAGAPELDVESSWRNYIAWCVEQRRPIHEARWARWVNDDSAKAKKHRVADRERRRATGTDGPRRHEPDMSNHPSRRIIRDEDLE